MSILRDTVDMDEKSFKKMQNASLPFEILTQNSSLANH